MNTAHELFLDELHDIYNAEHRLLGVLREAEQESQRGDLKRAFGRHRKQTEGHIKRLDSVFRSLDEEPREKNCEGLEGLIREKQTAETGDLSPELRDLNSLIAAVKVERYESSAYEALIFLAQQMGHREAIGPLKETLREEQETAKALLELLKASKIDWQAGMDQEVASPPRRRRAA